MSKMFHRLHTTTQETEPPTQEPVQINPMQIVVQIWQFDLAPANSEFGPHYLNEKTFWVAEAPGPAGQGSTLQDSWSSLVDAFLMTLITEEPHGPVQCAQWVEHMWKRHRKKPISAVLFS